MMKQKLNRIIVFFIFGVITFVLANPGSASQSLVGGNTSAIKISSVFIKPKAAINQIQDSDIEAACSLLDEPETRSMMSAMLETKLLLLCDRSEELNRRLDRRSSPSGPRDSIEAWADTLVNYPTTDVGDSTTQSETSIRVNPTTGTICAAYNDSQHWAQGNIAFAGFSRSTDSGLTFTDQGPFPPGGGGNSFGDPSLLWREADGYFYYASLHSNGLGIWRSTDDCQSFTYLSMIHTGGGDDKEIMEVDNNLASSYYGRIYVAWTDFAAGSRIYSTYSDNGTIWSAPVALSAAGVAAHGAWPAVAPNGDVYVAWVRWNPYPTGPIDIEVVRSTDGGTSFSPVTNPMTGGVNPRDATASANCARPALHANEPVINDGIRYLPSPQIAAGPDGCLHVVYVRDPDGYNTGDVINSYYRRSCDNGATWGPEILLNDDATLTDQYFPTVSVGPENIVVATWYDRRNDPGNNYLIDYYKAYSQDGGLTWGPNIRVSDISTPIPQLNPNFDPVVATCYYGDYDQQVQDNKYVYILWSDSRNVQNGHPDPDIWFEKELMYATGTLTGTVYDDSSMAPIVDALVRAENPWISFEDITNPNGDYTMQVLSGTYGVTAMAYGYDPSTVNGVVVLSGTVTLQDFYLTAKDFHTVDGTVTDSITGWPLYAVIHISGYPGSPIFTDPLTGYYSVSLSEDVPYVFNVMAILPGYIVENRPVGPLTGDAVEDFELDANLVACMAPGYEPTFAYIEDFEGGYGNWTMNGLWNEENEGDTCGSMVVPFPSPINDAYYGNDTTCNYDTGSANSGELTMVSSVPLPPSGGAALRFMSYEETECGGDCGYDNRYVEVSTNGGGTWSPLGEGNVEDTWYERFFDLAPYLGQNVLVRFRFDSVDSIGNSYFGWMVDNVRIQTDCQPIPGGLVVGNVLDANTNEGLPGAIVTNDSGEMVYAIPTPLDPNLEDGFYSIFSPAGTHTFTATLGAPYGDDVDNVGVVLDDVVYHNFELPAGWLSSLPDALDVPVLLGTDLTVPLTLTNLGGLDASYEINEGDICHVAIMSDNGSGPNEIAELHATLNELGFSWVDVMDTTEAYIAGANVLIDRYAAINLPYADIDAWLNDGLGYIELGDWPDWFPDNWEGQPAGTPLSLSVADPSHPLADGLPTNWTGLGFWAYDWSSDAIGWVTDVSYPNIIEGQYGTLRERAVSYEEVGTGRAVYVGFNTYGSLAGGTDKQVLSNAIKWSGQCSFDVLWLSEDPITGTLAATSDWVVDVTLDAMAPVITQTGQYFADLRVQNDTPYGNHVVPVTMTVVDTVIADVDLLSDMALTGDTGTPVIYTLEVINNGNLIDNFDVGISGNNWTTSAPLQVKNLYPNQGKTFEVTVMVPMSAVNDAKDVATVTVISQNNPTASASVNLTTTARGSQVFLPITFRE